MPSLEDEFGDVIKKARYGLGLERGAVAARTGISETRLAALEAYEAHPEHGECDRLAAVLGLRPVPLWTLAQTAWAPEPIADELGDGLWVQAFTFPPIASHAYLVGRGLEAILVDAGGDASGILKAVDARRVKLAAILVTHGHGDHVGALAEVHAASGAPVYAHPLEKSPEILACSPIPVKSGDRLDVARLDVEVLDSAGHTPGGVAYFVDGRACFVGDTLFAASLGRAAQSAAYPTLLQSGRRLLQLPPDVVLYPGHGPETTVAEQCEHNPFVSNAD